MTETVATVLSDIGVQRVTHFTPSKNLFHIVQDGQIRSSAELAAQAPEYFDPTDVARFDLRPDMTCTSLTYPNAYYLAKARVKAQFARFPDWVCLLLDARILTRPGVLFSSCNASKGSGMYVQEGPAGLRACFADPSLMGYTRGQHHHPHAATDLQAEALVPGPIPLSDLLGIVVPSDQAAGNEFARLEVAGLEPMRFRWIIGSTMFNRNSLSGAIQYGRAIEETLWTPPTTL